MSESKEYILGISQTELERLEFQHGVWKKVTDDFFKIINIRSGWKCLDVGAGPGFVSKEIREMTGDKGEVSVLEPSEFYLDYFKEISKKNNWSNIKYLHGNLEDVEIDKEYYDLIYSRWVIDFVPEPEKFLLKLLYALKKGGLIAIQDYIYEGIGLYPSGGPFDRIAEVVKAYWRIGGGDPYFIAKVPPLFRKNNIEMVEYSPVVLAGGNESGVFKWADRFFTGHLQTMSDMKIISEKEKNDLLNDWNDHKKNPDTVFVSPIVVNVIGRKL